MRLISMVDYVLEQDLETPKGRKISEIVKYGLFLKQPLELWMFVPCDKEGNVLEAVPYYADGIEKVNEYKKAKERCLFEGFAIEEESFISNIPHFYLEIDGVKIMWNFNDKWVFYKGFKTVEDLIKYDLQLTQTAIKQIS